MLALIPTILSLLGMLWIITKVLSFVKPEKHNITYVSDICSDISHLEQFLQQQLQSSTLTEKENDTLKSALISLRSTVSNYISSHYPSEPLLEEKSDKNHDKVDRKSPNKLEKSVDESHKRKRERRRKLRMKKEIELVLNQPSSEDDSSSTQQQEVNFKSPVLLNIPLPKTAKHLHDNDTYESNTSAIEEDVSQNAQWDFDVTDVTDDIMVDVDDKKILKKKQSMTDLKTNIKSLKDLDVNSLLGKFEKSNQSSSTETKNISPVTSSSHASTHNTLFNLFDQPGSTSTEKSKSHNANELVKDFATIADINQAGLRRCKKQAVFMPGQKKGSSIQMEDRHLVKIPIKDESRFGFIGIFDGHVGKNCAQEAQEIVFNEFCKSVENINSSEKIENLNELFLNLFLESDEKLKKYEFEGCTGSVVIIWKEENEIFIQSANVGDSSVYWYDFNTEKVISLSVDHKVISRSEKERMRAAGVEISDSQTRISGLTVSRAFGDFFAKDNNLGLICEPFISDKIKVGSGGGLLIAASDGLWDVISGVAGFNMIKDMDYADDMASNLIHSALGHKDCTDNITVCVVKV